MPMKLIGLMNNRGGVIGNPNMWNPNLWTDWAAGKPETCETETPEPVSVGVTSP